TFTALLYKVRLS
ncbi:toxin secretion ATP-binding domain protein, partial [Vibrio parahaemolyticus V-223/04]